MNKVKAPKCYPIFAFLRKRWLSFLRVEMWTFHPEIIHVLHSLSLKTTNNPFWQFLSLHNIKYFQILMSLYGLKHLLVFCKWKVYSKSPDAITVCCHVIQYCPVFALSSYLSTYNPTSVFEGHSNKPICDLVFQGKARNWEEHLLLWMDFQSWHWKLVTHYVPQYLQHCLVVSEGLFWADQLEKGYLEDTWLWIK